MVGLTDAPRALGAIDLEQGLSATEVRHRLRQALHLRSSGQRLLAFYLGEMADRGLHRSTGHRTATLYAEEVLGIEARRAREFITVGRKLLKLPRIDQAFCDQRLGWSKLLLVLSVVVPEHEEAWLVRALELSVRELALRVKLEEPGNAPRKPGETKGTPEVRFPHAFTLAPVAHRMGELAQDKLSAELDRPVTEAECFAAMAELFLSVEEDGSVPGRKRIDASLYRVVLRPTEGSTDGPLTIDTELGPVPLEADGEIDEARVRREAEVVVVADDDGPEGPDPADGESAPATPASLRKKVLARDGGACRRCRSSRGLHAHHIRYRSRGGPTKAWNLLTLCAPCHALVHEDLLILKGTRAEEIEFDHPQASAVDNNPGTGGAPLPVLRPPVVTAPVVTGEEVTTRLVTLESVPPSIDGAWWRAHEHLLRFRRGLGLEFRAGEARTPASSGEAREPLPDTTAFAGILGQDALVARLQRAAIGSRAFGRCFPHTCLVGPAGTGKTTLARSIRRACGSSLISTSGPLLQDTHALVALLASLTAGGSLFIDEIHAVPQGVLETLYEAMAEQRLELTLQDGVRARTVELQLPPFTLLAATTEDGMLSTALRSRFGIFETLGFYESAPLAELACARARRSGFELTSAAAQVLAGHARGTPREALRLVDRVLEDAIASGAAARLGERAVRQALTRLGYNAEGLGPGEQQYMALLRESPRPIPLQRLARMIGASVQTLMEHVEPWLFRRGLVEMTPRGRQAALGGP